MSPNTPDSFRNARLKIIPRVFSGSWIVKKSGTLLLFFQLTCTVGTKPAIIGNKLTCRLFSVLCSCLQLLASFQLLTTWKSM